LIRLALTFSALWFVVLNSELPWGRGDDDATPTCAPTPVADSSKPGWLLRADQKLYLFGTPSDRSKRIGEPNLKLEGGHAEANFIPDWRDRKYNLPSPGRWIGAILAADAGWY